MLSICRYFNSPKSLCTGGPSSHKQRHQNIIYPQAPTSLLDELLESVVDGRADVGHALPEVDGGNSTLGDTLGGELELL